MKKVFILFGLIWLGAFVYAQNSPVLVPELQGKYEGKIKNGLANGKGMAVGKDKYEGYFKKGLPDGKGIYIWANGDVYEGYFKRGKLEGKGKLKFKFIEKDSILVGIFENSVYIGTKPLPDIKVIQLHNADGVLARKTADDRDVIFVHILRDARPAPISNLMVNVTSGTYTIYETYVHVENYILPLTINLRYTLPGYLTGTIDVTVEFIMQNKGQFKVDVKNF